MSSPLCVLSTQIMATAERGFFFHYISKVSRECCSCNLSVNSLTFLDCSTGQHNVYFFSSFSYIFQYLAKDTKKEGNNL